MHIHIHIKNMSGRQTNTRAHPIRSCVQKKHSTEYTQYNKHLIRNVKSHAFSPFRIRLAMQTKWE